MPWVKLSTGGSGKGKRSKGNSGVLVEGAEGDSMLVRLAHCCNPVTGDDIVGFITRGRGVSVHRATCPNVKGLMEHPERMIGVSWDNGADALFQVESVVECVDDARRLMPGEGSKTLKRRR